MQTQTRSLVASRFLTVSIRLRLLASSTMSSALLNSWIFFSVLNLLSGGIGISRVSSLIRTTSASWAKCWISASSRKTRTSLASRSKWSVAILCLDHGVVVIAALDLMLERGVDHLRRP